MRNTSAATARPADARQGLLSRGRLVAKGTEGRGSLARPAPPSPPHVRRTRGPHTARRRLSVCGSPARTAGSEGLGPRPGHCPAAPGARWGRCPRAGRRGPHLGKATGSPGSCGVPTGAGPGAGPGSGAGGGVPGGRRAGGGPGPGEGRLTEIDVSEGAAADLPAQPVPVPDSELHGGGGGPGSLLPSRPLPGSELGEAAPLLPLLRVRLPTPPPSRPRFHHRFPAAPPLPAPQ